jgi:hypothetical protein
VPNDNDSDARALNYQRALASFTRIAGEQLSAERLMQNTAAQVSRVTHIKHVKVMVTERTPETSC